MLKVFKGPEIFLNGPMEAVISKEKVQRDGFLIILLAHCQSVIYLISNTTLKKFFFSIRNLEVCKRVCRVHRVYRPVNERTRTEQNLQCWLIL